ncbi:MAG: hypothetical protein GY718_01825 [Lentisphaerae bacterium]|nr:hypothetical protein [Lentisphaerota bacterium]
MTEGHATDSVRKGNTPLTSPHTSPHSVFMCPQLHPQMSDEKKWRQ